MGRRAVCGQSGRVSPARNLYGLAFYLVLANLAARPIYERQTHYCCGKICSILPDGLSPTVWWTTFFGAIGRAKPYCSSRTSTTKVRRSALTTMKVLNSTLNTMRKRGCFVATCRLRGKIVGKVCLRPVSWALTTLQRGKPKIVRQLDNYPIVTKNVSCQLTKTHQQKTSAFQNRQISAS